MREQIRHDVFGDREIAEGVESGREIAVAFADLVGFTKLGERLDPAEIGRLTDRLGELAGDVAGGPVRLVKLIGDAAMLSSNDPGALLDARSSWSRPPSARARDSRCCAPGPPSVARSRGPATTTAAR